MIDEVDEKLIEKKKRIESRSKDKKKRGGRKGHKEGKEREDNENKL